MVLTLSQALLGSVFPNLRAASVEVFDQSVVIHFLLDDSPSVDDQEELDGDRGFSSRPSSDRTQ